MITEKCTYRLQIADQIDPKRENPSLPPNFQQKLFDYDTESQLLCRTLLQAKVMFRKEFQSTDIIERAMRSSFGALGDLLSMHETAQSFELAEQGAIEKAKTLQQKDLSQTIPAVGNVRPHCKTFIQKADHFAVSLLRIVRLFYPEMKGKNWEAFDKLVKFRYGENDAFCKVSGLATPFLKLIRNTRDCLEHGDLTAVTTSDLAPQSDGRIALPSIKIDFRNSRQDRCPVSWFMKEATKALIDTFEMIVVHMCRKNMHAFPGLPMVIAPVPESHQKAWHVHFAYGTYRQDGQFTPCG